MDSDQESPYLLQPTSVKPSFGNVSLLLQSILTAELNVDVILKTINQTYLKLKDQSSEWFIY